MRLDAHEAAGACLERENGEEKDLRHGESDQSGLRRAQNDKQCAARLACHSLASAAVFSRLTPTQLKKDASLRGTGRTGALNKGLTSALVDARKSLRT